MNSPLEQWVGIDVSKAHLDVYEEIKRLEQQIQALLICGMNRRLLACNLDRNLEKSSRPSATPKFKPSYGSPRFGKPNKVGEVVGVWRRRSRVAVS